MDPETIKTALEFAIGGAASGGVSFASTELLKASKKLFKRLRKITAIENDLADYSSEEAEALSREIAEAAEQDVRTAALLSRWLKEVDILRTQGDRPIKQSSVSVGVFSNVSITQTIELK